MKTAEIIRERAFELGFDLFGISAATRASTAANYLQWLQRGMQGGMAWMERQLERRCDPRDYLAGARSVISVGISYAGEEPASAVWNDPMRGRIARFAWGADYHDVLKPKLVALAKTLDRIVDSGCRSRACIDTSPVLERDMAIRSGIGYPGFNTNIISPQYGSYIFLGEVITCAELEPSTPSPSCRHLCSECGECRASCPTEALIEPYVCDSRLCISYLTIENKGSIPRRLRPKMKDWIFGCDACQECCPQLERISAPRQSGFLRFDSELFAPHLLELMELDQESFRKRYRKTPIARIKRRGLLRNAAVALGNSGDANALEVLERSLDDPEQLVREHAAWAIEQIVD